MTVYEMAEKLVSMLMIHTGATDWMVAYMPKSPYWVGQCESMGLHVKADCYIDAKAYWVDAVEALRDERRREAERN